MATAILTIIASILSLAVMLYGKKLWVLVLQWWQNRENKSETEKLVQGNEALNQKLNNDFDKLKKKLEGP